MKNGAILLSHGVSLVYSQCIAHRDSRSPEVALEPPAPPLGGNLWEVLRGSFQPLPPQWFSVRSPLLGTRGLAFFVGTLNVGHKLSLQGPGSSSTNCFLEAPYQAAQALHPTVGTTCCNLRHSGIIFRRSREARRGSGWLA